MIDRPALPDEIRRGRIVAIGRGLSQDQALNVAAALVRGGIWAFEITLQTQDSIASISAVSAAFAERGLLVGAGTVLTIDAASRAVDAGARFLVMPHTDPTLISWAAANRLVAIPGGLSPTEILVGWRAGAAAIKVFPASVAGLDLIRELQGPLPDIPLIPTGGITAETAPAWFEAGALAVGVGSWLVGAGDAGVIEARARKLVGSVGDRHVETVG